MATFSVEISKYTFCQSVENDIPQVQNTCHMISKFGLMKMDKFGS